jgi:hypothetical protein
LNGKQASAAKLTLEARLAEDLVHRALAALLEHPVQFAIDTAERARDPFLQARPFRSVHA